MRIHITFGFKNVCAAEKRYLIYVVSILSDEDETLTQIYLRTDIWYLKGLSVATCVVKCNDFHSLQPPDQPTNVPRHFWSASVPVLGSHSKYNQRGRVSRNELKWSLSVSVSVISISDLKEINHVPGEKCNVYKKLFLEFLMMPEINIFPEDCSPEVGCHNVQAGINTHCSWSHLHPWVTIYSYLLISIAIYWYLLTLVATGRVHHQREQECGQQQAGGAGPGHSRHHVTSPLLKHCHLNTLQQQQ